MGKIFLSHGNVAVGDVQVSAIVFYNQVARDRPWNSNKLLPPPENRGGVPKILDCCCYSQINLQQVNLKSKI